MDVVLCVFWIYFVDGDIGIDYCINFLIVFCWRGYVLNFWIFRVVRDSF